MSYLKFDKNLMINLEQSLPKEMLRTNQSGAYHCTTIVGCNTRKQHGLLVIPIPEMDDDNHVLLSSLDETVIQHGAPFNLGLHKYNGNCFSPNGHKYIREYDCETVPRTTYRVGGVILTKEKIFISHENRILIRYTLVDAHSQTILQFRPFLAFRNANDLCVENGMASREYHETVNGIATCMYPGYPTLFMQFSKKPEFVFSPNWYKGIEYTKDQERGIPYREDLYVPGYFQLEIKKGESIIFSAGTSEAEPEDFAAMYESEIKSRTPRTSFYNCLKNCAKQFYVTNAHGRYILAGYPWFKIRARDEMIALPGCTISVHHRPDFEGIMETAVKAYRHFMKTGQLDRVMQGIDLPDIPLWQLWAIQQYYKEAGAEETIKRYGDFIKEVLEYIITNSHPNLDLNEAGLLSSNGKAKPISWMDASYPGGSPIIPRTGYLVEFNALWYNDLMFAQELFANTPAEAENVKKWESITTHLKDSFIETFLNDYGYLYDYVSGLFTDLSVRPNMIIAAGLDYSPLDRRQRRSVLDIVTRELLTPKGLRTLSPKSFGYTPCYLGSPEQREYAYYQGPARPWLMGFYADAYFKVFGMSGVSFIERMMIGFEDEMTQGCIGSLSELYDGNPPYTGRGAVSFAANVGGVLRVLRQLKNLNL